MKIAFNLHGCGAGNNGGTRTLFKSAIELANLKQEVEIWSDTPNQFTWFNLPPEVPFLVKPDINHYDPVDVLFATGSGTVDSTVAFKKKKHGFYWVRAIELWNATEESLIRGYRAGLKVFVNALWMKDWIWQKARVESALMRPGVEIDFFTPPSQREGGPVVVGALYSPKPRKRACDVRKVFTEIMEKHGTEVERWVISNEEPDAGFPADRWFVRPSEKEKREMFQRVSIWFAPTDSEGLHVVPLEAGACGCALVAHGKPSAGMGDYAIHKKTALVYGEYDIKQATDFVASLVDEELLRCELGTNLRGYIVRNIGSRRKNMLEFLHDNFHEKVKAQTRAKIDSENRKPTKTELTILNYTRDKQRLVPKITLREQSQVTPFIAIAKKRGFGKSSRILDMGCRFAPFLAELKRRGWLNITGIDICEEHAQVAKAMGVNAVCADATNTDFADSSFDIIRSRNMIEHTPEPLDVIREQVRLLKPGGFCLNHFPIEPDASVKHFSLTSEENEQTFLDGLKPLLEQCGAVSEYYGPCGELGLIPHETKPGRDKALLIKKEKNMKVFINCGSNDGRTTREFVKQRGDNWDIYSFEANPYHFPFYKKIPGTLVKKAVWIRDEVREFYLGGDPANPRATGSSLMSEKNNLFKDEEPLQVECVDFSKWIADNFSKDTRLVVKMNIEGAEYAILAKMIEDGTIDYLDELFVGWHSHKCNDLIEEDEEGRIRRIVKERVPVVIGPNGPNWNYAGHLK